MRVRSNFDAGDTLLRSFLRVLNPERYRTLACMDEHKGFIYIINNGIKYKAEVAISTENRKDMDRLVRKKCMIEIDASFIVVLFYIAQALVLS